MSDNLNYNHQLLLVGAGQIAVEYAKVLSELKKPFIVVGRGQKSINEFKLKTAVSVQSGGIEKWVHKTQILPEEAIVAVDIENLAKVTTLLIKRGIKKILVEKPAGLNESEIKNLSILAGKTKASVFVAYNRRFYQSTIRAKEIIKKDGGVKSFSFEFTEFSHLISKSNKPLKIKSHWFLANSSHVVDLAFFLGGSPRIMRSFVSGQTSWHKKGSIFSGAGESVHKALFSYKANWEAPGRWGVELLTNKHKLILQPLEELWIQKIPELTPRKMILADQIDKEFKPGFFQQTKTFLVQNEKSSLLTIHQHHDQVKTVFSKILNSTP